VLSETPGFVGIGNRDLQAKCGVCVLQLLEPAVLGGADRGFSDRDRMGQKSFLYRSPSQERGCGAVVRIVGIHGGDEHAGIENHRHVHGVVRSQSSRSASR